MKKQDLANKAVKKEELKNKAPKKEKINFKELGQEMKIIALKGSLMEEGKEYTVSNNVAEILIKKKKAKLA